ncbi:EcsC family protein [Tissierella creatinini]|nr:EcsC family protein [Tissierella creatinini]TJX60566.1 EcsC family protein [Soehngenia saccharolytica]
MEYDDRARFKLSVWKVEMRKKPSFLEKASKDVQRKVNGMLPEKYHEIITVAIRNLTKTVLYGSQFVTKAPLKGLSLKEREILVNEKAKLYRTTATIEGAATGAGGFISGLADFPLLLGIKFKFLYDVASIYGFNVDDYRERLYILHIFQLAFSSKAHVNKVFYRMENWDEYIKSLPYDINDFDWRDFQQEYRDYLDIAKLLQMLPVVGAVVGSYVNHKLLKKLNETAINSYRMRLL